jgi:hypothetical protein
MSYMSAFLDSLTEIQRDFPNILASFVDNIWCLDGTQVSWNTDDSLEDLAYQNGNSYSAMVPENHKEIGNYTIMNVDTETGTWETLIFPNNKRKTIEELDNV